MRQISETVGGRDRKLDGVIQTGIPESPDAVHFEVADERVAVRHGAPSSPGKQVDAAQSERRRYQRRSGHVRPRDNAVRDLRWIERFAVQNELRVEFSGAPPVENRSDGCLRDTQQVCEWLEVGGECDDGANVQ